MGELSNKVAIVTGAASQKGIGFAMAKRFAASGASLLLVDTGKPEPLAERISELSGLPGAAGRIECALFDLAANGAAETMVDKALALFGRVDVL